MTGTLMQAGLMLILALAGPLTARAQETTDTAVQTTGTTAQMGFMNHGFICGTGKTTGTVGIVASNLPLRRVVAQLVDQSDVHIMVKGGAAEKPVTVIAPGGFSVEEALSLLESSNPDLLVRRGAVKQGVEDVAGYEIWDRTEYLKSAAVVEVYQVREASAKGVAPFVQEILNRGTGTVKADDRLNKLVVYDVPEKQEEVRNLLQELDEELVTRVFALQHSDADDMANQLQNFFSLPSDHVSADGRSGQVAVRATQEVIARVELLVTAFDVPPLAEKAAGNGAASTPRLIRKF